LTFREPEGTMSWITGYIYPVLWSFLDICICAGKNIN